MGKEKGERKGEGKWERKRGEEMGERLPQPKKVGAGEGEEGKWSFSPILGKGGGRRGREKLQIVL